MTKYSINLLTKCNLTEGYYIVLRIIFYNVCNPMQV